MDKPGSFTKMEKALPKLEKCDSLKSLPSDDSIKQPLHSILKNDQTDEDDFFQMRHFRPRANTDPISPRPRLRVHFDLPDIVVDDCSDNDEDNVDSAHPEEINEELANTNEGAFFVYKSPPRQRANTCPMNMFSKRRPRKNRPPTPPPMDASPQDTLPKYPSWEKVPFAPHTLTSVEETREVRESSVTDEKKTVTKSETTRSRKVTAPKLIKGRNSSNSGSPASSPKRTLPKIPNGHLTSKNSNAIDITG